MGKLQLRKQERETISSAELWRRWSSQRCLRRLVRSWKVPVMPLPISRQPSISIMFDQCLRSVGVHLASFCCSALASKSVKESLAIADLLDALLGCVQCWPANVGRCRRVVPVHTRLPPGSSCGMRASIKTGAKCLHSGGIIV